MENLADMVTRCGTGRDACIKLLQEIKAAYGYLPAEALRYVVAHTKISARQIYGVATFYERFRFRPMGRHNVKVCRGTACHVRGAPGVLNAVEQELKLTDGEDTTADGECTLEKVACFGACALAPVAVVDGRTQGAMTADRIRRLLKNAVRRTPASPAKGKRRPHA